MHCSTIYRLLHQAPIACAHLLPRLPSMKSSSPQFTYCSLVLGKARVEPSICGSGASGRADICDSTLGSMQCSASASFKQSTTQPRHGGQHRSMARRQFSRAAGVRRPHLEHGLLAAHNVVNQAVRLGLQRRHVAIAVGVLLYLGGGTWGRRQRVGKRTGGSMRWTCMGDA